MRQLRLATAFVPRLGIAPPAMGIVPFDDHPSVLLQLRGVETSSKVSVIRSISLDSRSGSAGARTTPRERAALTWPLQAQTWVSLCRKRSARIRVCSLSEHLPRVHHQPRLPGKFTVREQSVVSMHTAVCSTTSTPNASSATPDERFHLCERCCRVVAGGRRRQRAVCGTVLDRLLCSPNSMKPYCRPEAKLSPPPTRSRISSPGRGVASTNPSVAGPDNR